MCLQVVPPKPALTDVFTWVAGILAILFCGFAIWVAYEPLQNALEASAKGKLSNQVADYRLRLVANVLLSLANIAVWVVILRDKWLRYMAPQSSAYRAASVYPSACLLHRPQRVESRSAVAHACHFPVLVTMQRHQTVAVLVMEHDAVCIIKSPYCLQA